MCMLEKKRMGEEKGDKLYFSRRSKDLLTAGGARRRLVDFVAFLILWLVCGN